MANDGDELVIEQTGPDFMLDELERYMRASAFSDLSIQCRDQIQRKKFNFSLPLKITWQKKALKNGASCRHYDFSSYKFSIEWGPREKLISSAHCAVLAAVSPFLKKLARSIRSTELSWLAPKCLLACIRLRESCLLALWGEFTQPYNIHGDHSGCFLSFVDIKHRLRFSIWT